MNRFWPWAKKKPAYDAACKYKKATDEDFDTGKPVGQVTEDCVSARRDGQPCDLSQLVILEKGKDRRVAYARAGLTDKSQLTRKEHFGVVAGPKDGKKKTFLNVEIITDLKYCGQQDHPLLVFKPMHQAGETYKKVTSSKSLQVWRQGRLFDPAHASDSLILRMWQASLLPNVFSITARSCGCRPDGGIPTRELTAIIHVYPNDEYTMNLQLPPFKTASKSGGVQRELEFKYKVPEKKSEPRPRPDFQLLCNGLEEADAAELSRIINTILEIKQLIEEIKGTLLSVKVKVGWYFNLDYTLLEGELTGTWGWREYTDHRAFFGYAINVDLTILELTAGIGFGIDISIDFKLKQVGLIAKVDGSVTARFALAASVEHSSPDSPSFNDGEAKIKGSCHASISAHLMALHPTVFELYGEVETGMEIEGGLKVSNQDGFYIDAVARWTGVTAYGRATGIFGGKHKRIKLLKPHTLGQWQYPPVKEKTLPAAGGA